MNLFDGFRKKINESAIEESAAYRLVADELKRGYLDEGVWTKALAENDFDEARAKADYVRFRVAELCQDLRAFGSAINVGKEQRRRLEILLESGCNQEAIDYLGNPIHVSAYISKYRVTQDQIDHAIRFGKVRGYLVDGSLWLQDKKF